MKVIYKIQSKTGEIYLRMRIFKMNKYKMKKIQINLYKEFLKHNNRNLYSILVNKAVHINFFFKMFLIKLNNKILNHFIKFKYKYSLI